MCLRPFLSLDFQNRHGLRKSLPNGENFSGWLLETLLVEDELSLAGFGKNGQKLKVLFVDFAHGSRSPEDPKRLLQMLEMEVSREKPAVRHGECLNHPEPGRIQI